MNLITNLGSERNNVLHAQINRRSISLSIYKCLERERDESNTLCYGHPLKAFKLLLLLREQFK